MLVILESLVGYATLYAPALLLIGLFFMGAWLVCKLVMALSTVLFRKISDQESTRQYIQRTKAEARAYSPSPSMGK